MINRREAIVAIGAKAAKRLLKRVQETQRDGGLATADGSRKRTPGGVFFHLLRDEMTPEEEVAEEAARMKRMMDELNGGESKDYTGMDPNRVRLLKKLQSKGLSFMGGENMDIEQLEQLANAMDGINSKNGGDL